MSLRLLSSICHKLPEERDQLEVNYLVDLMVSFRVMQQMPISLRHVFAKYIQLKIPIGKEPVVKENEISKALYLVVEGKMVAYSNEETLVISHAEQTEFTYGLPHPAEIVKPKGNNEKYADVGILSQSVNQVVYVAGDYFGFTSMVSKIPLTMSFYSSNINTALLVLNYEDYIDIMNKCFIPGRLKPQLIKTMAEHINLINADVEAEAQRRFEQNSISKSDISIVPDSTKKAKNVLRKAVKSSASYFDSGKVTQKFIDICNKDSHKRSEADVRFVLKIIENIPFFAQFNEDTCLLFCRIVGHLKLEDSTLLFEQGEIGHKMFIVLTGSVSVHIRDSKTGVNLKVASSKPAKLYKGHLIIPPELNIEETYGKCVDILRNKTPFGEAAFMETGNKRGASIISREVTHFIYFDRSSFEKIVRVQFISDPVADDLALNWKSPVDRNPNDVRELAYYLKSLGFFEQFSFNCLVLIARKCWNVAHDLATTIPLNIGNTYFIIHGTIKISGSFASESTILVAGDRFDDNVSDDRVSDVIARASADTIFVVMKTLDFEQIVSRDLKIVFTDSIVGKSNYSQLSHENFQILVKDLTDIPFFRQVPASCLSKLAKFMTYKFVSPFQNLFEQGAPADKFFIVNRGCISLYSNYARYPLNSGVVDTGIETKNGECINIVCSCEVIGDLNYNGGNVYGCTAMALEGTHLFVIDLKTMQEKFFEILDESVSEYEITIPQIHDLIDAPHLSKISCAELYPILDNSPLFKNSSTTLKDEVISFLEHKCCGPGEMIVQQGESLHDIVFILDGIVELRRSCGKNLSIFSETNEIDNVLVGFLSKYSVFSAFPESFVTLKTVSDMLKRNKSFAFEPIRTDFSMKCRTSVRYITLPHENIIGVLNKITLANLMFYFPSVVKEVLLKGLQESEDKEFAEKLVQHMYLKTMGFTDIRQILLSPKDLYLSMGYVYAASKSLIVSQKEHPTDYYLVLSGSVTLHKSDQIVVKEVPSPAVPADKFSLSSRIGNTKPRTKSLSRLKSLFISDSVESQVESCPYGPVVSTLFAGDTFGGISSFTNIVVASCDSQFVRLSSASFSKHEFIKESEDRNSVSKSLQKYPLMRIFSSDSVYFMVSNMETINIPRGFLINRGRKCDGIFIILSGSCSIWCSNLDLQNVRHSPLSYLTTLKKDRVTETYPTLPFASFSTCTEIVTLGAGNLLGDIECVWKNDTFVFPYYVKATDAVIKFLPRIAFEQIFDANIHLSLLKKDNLPGNLVEKMSFWDRCLDRGSNFAANATALPALDLSSVLKLSAKSSISGRHKPPESLHNLNQLSARYHDT